MKRILMLLVAGAAAVIFGCSADTSPPTVASSDIDAQQTTPDSPAETRLISLSVPNMT